MLFLNHNLFYLQFPKFAPAKREFVFNICSSFYCNGIILPYYDPAFVRFSSLLPKLMKPIISQKSFQLPQTIYGPHPAHRKIPVPVCSNSGPEYKITRKLFHFLKDFPIWAYSKGNLLSSCSLNIFKVHKYSLEVSGLKYNLRL